LAGSEFYHESSKLQALREKSQDIKKAIQAKICRELGVDQKQLLELQLQECVSVYQIKA